MSKKFSTIVRAMSVLSFKIGEADAMAQADFQAEFAIMAGDVESKADFDALRDAFITGYVKGRGCQSTSAASRFAEFWKTTGLPKPQTAEAARKAELRAAKAKADKVNPAGNPADAIQAPTAGEAAAGDIGTKLAAADVHLISLIHRKLWAQAHEFIRSLEAA